MDGTNASWVAKGVRDNATNIVQVRARIPADLRTIPGEVYIIVPASATNGQIFTQSSSPGAPTTGSRVQFFDYSQLASSNKIIEYNAATQGSYRITVNSITSTHVKVTYTATLYPESGTVGAARHTTSGTIDVDTTSG